MFVKLLYAIAYIMKALAKVTHSDKVAMMYIKLDSYIFLQELKKYRKNNK